MAGWTRESGITGGIRAGGQKPINHTKVLPFQGVFCTGKPGNVFVWGKNEFPVFAFSCRSGSRIPGPDDAGYGRCGLTKFSVERFNDEVAQDGYGNRCF